MGLNVDIYKLPDSRVTLDGTIENDVKYTQYNVVRSAYHDFNVKFYSEHKKYKNSYTPDLFRVNKILETCKFYYGGCTFDLEYEDDYVMFTCTPDDIELQYKKVSITLCKFMDFTPELFCDFVLYESDTNEYKDYIIQYYSL